jgi:hypothetical protein
LSTSIWEFRDDKDSEPLAAHGPTQSQQSVLQSTANKELTAISIDSNQGASWRLTVLNPTADKKITEHASEPRAIWLATKTQSPDITHVLFELIMGAIAKLVQGDAGLPIHDQLMFLLLRLSSQSLPRKPTLTKFKHHEA